MQFTRSTNLVLLFPYSVWFIFLTIITPRHKCDCLLTVILPWNVSFMRAGLWFCSQYPSIWAVSGSELALNTSLLLYESWMNLSAPLPNSWPGYECLLLPAILFLIAFSSLLDRMPYRFCFTRNFFCTSPFLLKQGFNLHP